MLTTAERQIAPGASPGGGGGVLPGRPGADADATYDKDGRAYKVTTMKWKTE
jgi:hypothetical protein